MSAAPHPPDAGVLYGRHRARVFAFCLSRLRSREEAEDAVQATFLYAFRAIERGTVPRHEAVWLTKIAENVCRSRRRSLLRRARVESCADVAALEDPRPAADRPDELEGLPAALASLPDRQRHALLLREWQGLSYREIAEALTVSESAVETLLFRARRSLALRLRGLPARARALVDVGSLGGIVRSLLASTGGKAVAVAAAVGASSVAVVPPVAHRLDPPAAPRPHAPVATPAAATVRSRVGVAGHRSRSRSHAPAAVSRAQVLPGSPQGRGTPLAPRRSVPSPAAHSKPHEPPFAPAGGPDSHPAPTTPKPAPKPDQPQAPAPPTTSGPAAPTVPAVTVGTPVATVSVPSPNLPGVTVPAPEVPSVTVSTPVVTVTTPAVTVPLP